MTEAQQKIFSQYNQAQQEEVKDRIEELLFAKGNLAEEKFDDFLEKVMQATKSKVSNSLNIDFPRGAQPTALPSLFLEEGIESTENR